MIALLKHYAVLHPGEQETTGRVLSLLESEPRCFERDCFRPGHITASAWIVSRESRAVLLTHHRKLDRWLQLGGHTDGESDVLASALREAREESGLGDFGVIPSDGPLCILDVDVHAIPARGHEPAHEHHDVRFLLEASEHAPLARQRTESKALQWFPVAGIEARFAEESLARMARKAARWLARVPPGPV
ncbi:NUDIX hydrolase [Myxococcota bacterium]|nr:NUDIX hydrolase [Myxococcota bacterium]